MMKIMSFLRRNYLLILINLFAQVISWRDNSTLYLAGLFDLMSINELSNGSIILSKNEYGIQHLNTFLMAINEINNHSDGIMDNVLLSNHLRYFIDRNTRSSLTSNDYADGIISAQSILNKNLPLLGVISTLSDHSTESSLKLLNSYHIPSISSTSTSYIISDNELYQSTFRLPPSAASDSLIFFNILFKFQMNRIAVVYSVDSFGRNSFQSFKYQNQLRSSPLTILIEVPVFGTKDPRHLNELQQIKRSGATIICLFMSGEQAARLLSEAYNFGIIEPGMQYLGTNIADTVTTLETMHSQHQISSILRGYLSISSSPELYFHTLPGRQFLQRYRSQASTMSVNHVNNAIIRCNSGRDDSNVSNDDFIYKYHASGNNSTLCFGTKNFNDTHWNDLDPTILYTYAAVQNFAIVLNDLIGSFGTNGLVAIHHSELYSFVMNTSFNSVVGNISYFPGILPMALYGRGDRITGHLYRVENFNRDLYFSNQSNGIATVGYVGIDASSDFTFCNETQLFVNIVTCKQTVFSTLDNSAPKDTRSRQSKFLTEGVRLVFFILGSFVVLASIFILLVYYVYRGSKTIRNAQFKVVCLSTFGLLLAGVRVLTTGIIVNVTVCNVRLWIEHIAATLVITAYTLKLWRIHRIINTSGIRKVKLDENTLVAIMAVIVSVVVILLIILAGVNECGVEYYTTLESNEELFVPICKNSTTLAGYVVNLLIFGIEFVIAVAAVVLLYLTRDVPKIVNETSIIGPLLTEALVIIGVGGVIMLVVKPDPILSEVMLSSGYCFIALSCLIIYNAEKLSLLREDIQDCEPKEVLSDFVRLKPSSSRKAQPPSHDRRRRDAYKLVELESKNKAKLVMEQIDIYKAILVKIADEDDGIPMAYSGKVHPSSRYDDRMSHASHFSQMSRLSVGSAFDRAQMLSEYVDPVNSPLQSQKNLGLDRSHILSDDMNHTPMQSQRNFGLDRTHLYAEHSDVIHSPIQSSSMKNFINRSRKQSSPIQSSSQKNFIACEDSAAV